MEEKELFYEPDLHKAPHHRRDRKAEHQHVKSTTDAAPYSSYDQRLGTLLLQGDALGAACLCSCQHRRRHSYSGANALFAEQGAIGQWVASLLRRLHLAKRYVNDSLFRPRGHLLGGSVTGSELVRKRPPRKKRWRNPAAVFAVGLLLVLFYAVLNWFSLLGGCPRFPSSISSSSFESYSSQHQDTPQTPHNAQQQHSDYFRLQSDSGMFFDFLLIF